MTEFSIAPITAPIAQSATDQVFDALYAAVVSVRLPPGAKVSEADVAKQLDVSRQPVRDAFFRLSKLGFLSIRPQRATLITKISERAVLDAAFVRTALELECIRIVTAGRTPADLQDLRMILARQVEAFDTPDREPFHVLDESFHQTLCRMAGHDHVWALIQEQKAHMDRVRFLTLSQSRRVVVHGEHTAIVDAIEAQDVTRAESLLRDHLGVIRETLKQTRVQHADYFEELPA